MRAPLTELLYKRYPSLYQQESKSPAETAMCWGFDCDDGWFSLIDALSKTITEIDPACQAVQVKEKFASLRFYFRGTLQAVLGAESVASAYSTRVCEVTGLPGDLMLTEQGWYKTLSDVAAAEIKFSRQSLSDYRLVRGSDGTPADSEPQDVPPARRRLRLSAAESIDLLRARHANAFTPNVEIEFPIGGFDLIDITVGNIVPHRRPGYFGYGKPQPQIKSIYWPPSGRLVIDVDQDSLVHVAQSEIDSAPVRRIGASLEAELEKQRARLDGLNRFLAHMSAGIHPTHGAIGPVDDHGFRTGKNASLR